MSTICVQSTKRILGTTLLSPCLSSILTLDSSFQTSGRRQGRSFATRSPGSDPLELLKESSEKRGFCDADGIRKKDVHWTFSISTSGACLESPPSLRTIDFQRVSSSGIDFIRKRGIGSSNLISDKASSILCTFGRYRTGEKVEQWAAEGHCEQVVDEEFDLLKVVPERSIVELVASRIIREEDGAAKGDEHKSMDAASHYLEVVQKTRNRLESGDLTRDELHEVVAMVKFVPNRMERYIGGPDQVIWDRWEWKREGSHWKEPTRLLPY